MVKWVGGDLRYAANGSVIQIEAFLSIQIQQIGFTPPRKLEIQKCLFFFNFCEAPSMIQLYAFAEDSFRSNLFLFAISCLLRSASRLQTKWDHSFSSRYFWGVCAQYKQHGSWTRPSKHLWGLDRARRWDVGVEDEMEFASSSAELAQMMGLNVEPSRNQILEWGLSCLLNGWASCWSD